METKEKLSQLKPDLRAARIEHLRNLFRLSFRTQTAYDEVMHETMEEEDQFREEHLETVWEGDVAGFGDVDESELAEFQADFAELGATDVFVQCCIDYYEDVWHELNQKVLRAQKGLARATSAEQLRTRDRIILNLKHQKQIEAKLQELYQTRGPAPEATRS